MYEIYRHLGEWLMGKDEYQLEQRYLQIGSRRAGQRVPLSEVIWVIILTKENLWDFIKRNRFWNARWKCSVNWKCCNCWSSSLTGQLTLLRSVTSWQSRNKLSEKHSTRPEGKEVQL